MEKKVSQSDNRLKFYFPDVRLLTDEEIDALPEEKKNAVKSSGKPGVWMEVRCPGDTCITDMGKVTLSAIGAEASSKKGVFLDLFCPEDTCELTQATDLP